MWIWESKDWPHFIYDKDVLREAERQYLKNAGECIGSVKFFSDEDQENFKIELLTDEATQTAKIEGELLNRDSVQVSMRRQMGLSADNRKIPPSEHGVSSMMLDLYNHFAEPLSDEMLFYWHRQLMNGRTDDVQIGAYRTGTEPMQIIAGNVYDSRVYYEAPPSKQIPDEMRHFIDWFNNSQKMNALERSGLAHLYFVLIHPFDDGNGRIARALAEKALAQEIAQPSLTALAYTIESEKKSYYAALEQVRELDVTKWLSYFAETVLKAQQNTLDRIRFILQKTKLYDRLRGQLNSRQEKVLARMFREGIHGFKGGLSAANYMKISGTSSATATRDLKDMVEKGALLKTGELKHARYYLNIGNEK